MGHPAFVASVVGLDPAASDADSLAPEILLSYVQNFFPACLTRTYPTAAVPRTLSQVVVAG